MFEELLLEFMELGSLAKLVIICSVLSFPLWPFFLWIKTKAKLASSTDYVSNLKATNASLEALNFELETRLDFLKKKADEDKKAYEVNIKEVETTYNPKLWLEEYGEIFAQDRFRALNHIVVRYENFEEALAKVFLTVVKDKYDLAVLNGEGVKKDPSFKVFSRLADILNPGSLELHWYALGAYGGPEEFAAEFGSCPILSSPENTEAISSIIYQQADISRERMLRGLDMPSIVMPARVALALALRSNLWTSDAGFYARFQHMNMAETLGDLEFASTLLERLIADEQEVLGSEDNRVISAKLFRAKLHIRNREHSKALHELEHILPVLPKTREHLENGKNRDYPLALGYLVTCYIKLGRLQKALENARLNHKARRVMRGESEEFKLIADFQFRVLEHLSNSISNGIVELVEFYDQCVDRFGVNGHAPDVLRKFYLDTVWKFGFSEDALLKMVMLDKLTVADLKKADTKSDEYWANYFAFQEVFGEYPDTLLQERRRWYSTFAGRVQLNKSMYVEVDGHATEPESRKS